MVWDDGDNTCGNPAPVVDHQTGTIWLLSSWNLGSDSESKIADGTSTDTRRVYVQKSEDDGLTWSLPLEITADVKLADWTWYATGPGAGIQLQRGAQAGRLVIPSVHFRSNKDRGSHVVFSDDHGQSWQIGAVALKTASVSPNENLAVELIAPAPDGGSRLYFNARDRQGPHFRAETFSTDGGSNYASGIFLDAPQFVTPMVQGGLTRFLGTDLGDAGNRLLFSCPNIAGGTSYATADRSRISIWSSFDEAATWSATPRLVYEGPSAYSDMLRIDTDLMGILYEKGAVSPYETITFARFNTAWLDLPPPPPENPKAAFWTLDEKAAGENASTGARDILDLHPDGNDLHLTASAAFPVVAGAPAFGGGRALALNANGGLFISDADSANAFDFGPHDSFTVEIVCRVPNGSTQVGGLVAKEVGPLSPSWWLRVDNGNVRFLVSDTGAEPNVWSTGKINDGAWHHIAAVRDASDPDNKRLRLYIDGQPAGEIADTTTQSLANGNALWVGSFNNGARRFTGEIDFVRISPGALLPGQFAARHTQLDADGDFVPDAYERERTGTLSEIGTPDPDEHQPPDYVKYALAMDPLDPDAAPVLSLQTTGEGLTVSFDQRELPAWLVIQLEQSLDLTGWDDAEGAAVQDILEGGVIRNTYTLPYPDGIPDRSFFCIRVDVLP